jgi:hypothetical protein
MVNSPRTLEDVLADVQDELPVLRKHGQTQLAETLERFASDVRKAAADWLTWMDEDDAMLRTDHSRKWLRARFAEWAEQGHARWKNGRRQYRRAIIPQRGNPHAAREAGRQAALEEFTRGQRAPSR